jgi:hypothetical protein
MSQPRAVPFVAIVFTVAFAVAYMFAVWKNYALFTYHPTLGTVAWGVEKPRDGPAMYWYGWLATAAIAALAACLVASVVPERFARRVWTGWSWAAPIGVLVFFAWLLRGYFLR